MKNILIFLLKLVFTGACLWWAFSQVKLDHTVSSELVRVDHRWIIGGVILAGISIFLQSLRWWFFLRAQALNISVSRCTELTLIDGLFSLASFGGLGGSAARVILLTREYPQRKLVISMAVMVDHLAGMVALAGIFFMLSAPRFDALILQSALGKGVFEFARFYLGGGLLMVAMIFIIASPPVHRLLHAHDSFSQWSAMKRIPEVCDIFRKKWSYTAAGLASSCLMLIVYFSSYFCGLRAIGGLESYYDVVSAMPVIDVMSGLPISISGVGVREKMFEVLMKDLADVPPRTAVAASLVGFFCNMVWALLGACLFMVKKNRGTTMRMADS